MAVTTSSTLTMSLIMNQVDTGAAEDSASQDVIEMARIINLTDGTGNGNANKIFRDSNTLSSGENALIDLYDMDRSLFGGTINVNMSGGRIRFLILENTSTGLGSVIQLVNTGTNDLKGFTGGQSAYLPVAPSGMLILNSRYSGYPVEDTSRYLRINNGPYTSSYEIGIVGSV